MRERRRRAGRLLSLLALPLIACSDEAPTEPDEPLLTSFELRLEMVASGLSSPVHLTSPPGDPRLFVVEQPGRIRSVQNGQLLAVPFTPTYAEYIYLKGRRVLADQMEYLLAHFPRTSPLHARIQRFTQ